MVTRTYVNCLLTIALSNLGNFCGFSPKSPCLFSLFSVALLTIQEATSNEIKDLRGGGLQSEIGGWARQRSENAQIEAPLPTWSLVLALHCNDLFSRILVADSIEY